MQIAAHLVGTWGRCDNVVLAVAVIHGILEADIFKRVWITWGVFFRDLSVTQSLAARGLACIGFGKNIVVGIGGECAQRVVKPSDAVFRFAGVDAFGIAAATFRTDGFGCADTYGAAFVIGAGGARNDTVSADIGVAIPARFFKSLCTWGSIHGSFPLEDALARVTGVVTGVICQGEFMIIAIGCFFTSVDFNIIALAGGVIAPCVGVTCGDAVDNIIACHFLA